MGYSLDILMTSACGKGQVKSVGICPKFQGSLNFGQFLKFGKIWTRCLDHSCIKEKATAANGQSFANCSLWSII